MKKFIAVLLSITLLAALGTTAFAELLDPATGRFAPGSKIVVDRTDANRWDTIPPADIAIETNNYSLAGQSWSKGKDLISSVRIDNDEGAVVITLKEDYTSKKTKYVNGIIKLRLKKTGQTFTYTADFEVGYNQEDILIQSDGYIPPLSVSPDTVYTVKADNAGYPYGTLNFMNDNSEVSVRVYEKETYYLESTREPDREVLKANADSDAVMEFLTFKAHPTFSSTATLTFHGFEKNYYVYENKGGKLTRINTTWDKDMEAHVVKTRTLGSYVVSDKPLKSATGTTTDGTTTGGTTGTNPDTGANDVAGIALALAIVSGVSAAAISLKKSK